MKHKGVIIELTALLDVIFIMLFWVMMNLQQQKENQAQNYESQIQEQKISHEQEISEIQNNYESQIDEINSQHENEISEIEENYQKELDELNEIAENSNSWAYYQALENYSEDAVITLNLQYDSMGRTGKLSLNDKDSEISHTTLDSHNRTSDNSDVKKIEKFINANLDLNSDDIVLCAFVYNGSHATSNDVDNVKKAINNVRRNYSNFYCTYVNLNK